MTRFIPTPIRGAIVFLGLVINTVSFSSLLFPVAMAKLAVPLRRWRIGCTHGLHWIAETWMNVCLWLFARFSQIHWEIQGDISVNRKKWYLLVANHQSWVDIFVVLKVFRRRIPFPKFFLKRELIWVPFLGFAWWALDYPFMRRNAAKRAKSGNDGPSKDMEAARKACTTFRLVPSTVMNFVEGTRFTKLRHQAQNSPFKHLLKPRAGGLSFALSTLGEKLHRILNVTITYPEGERGFWAFMCGKIRHIKVHVETLPVQNVLLGDYMGDPKFRERFQAWVNELWADKDRLIDDMLHPQAVTPLSTNEG